MTVSRRLVRNDLLTGGLTGVLACLAIATPARTVAQDLAPTEAATASTVPGPPRNLTVEAVGPSRIDLDWDPPSSDGGAQIIGYVIQISEDGRRTWSPLHELRGATATSYSHTGLPPRVTRHYRIRAVNRFGSGFPSNVAWATTAADRPGAPTGLRAVAQGPSRIRLDWTAPRYTGGAPLTGYRVEVSENAGRSWSVLVAITRSTTHVHTGLPARSTRHYRVSAINQAGTGRPSGVARATTESTVPGRPLALSATAAGASRIDLSWNAPADDGGERLTGYRIEVSRDRGSTWRLLVSTSSPSTTYTHQNLEPATTYHYRVAAINRAGVGPFSAPAGAITDPAAPGPPRNLMATAVSHSRIDLRWDPPSDDGGALISGYRIEVSEDRRRTWSLLARRAAHTTSYSHTSLPPNTTRHYRVYAVNAAGAGQPSGVAWATTAADVPGAPTGLEAVEDGTSRIDLSWNAPGNTGGAFLLGYRIEVSENAGRTWSVLVATTRTTGTTYAHTGLPAGSTRHYRVSAINQVGVGEPSGVASATTESSVPGAPTALTASADGTSRIDLAWTTPAHDGGERITGYRIEVSEDGGFSWSDLVGNTRNAEPAYAHTGLEPATTRHYRVSAINLRGAGAASNVATATTDATVPDAPTGLTATSADATRIDLSWTAPANDGGAAITGYRIEVSENGTSWTDLVTDTRSTTTTFSHTGLEPGSTRFYRVAAINPAGTGLPSLVAFASTDDAGARSRRVGESILPHAAAAMTSSTVSAIASRVDAVASRDGERMQANLGRASSLAGAQAVGGINPLGGGRNGMSGAGWLLQGSSFVLPVGTQSARQERGILGTLSTWGGGDFVSMGEPGAADIDWTGSLTSLHVGADVRVQSDILAGVVATTSGGSFDFTDHTGANPVSGTYGSRLTTVNPYAAWLLDGQGSVVWATAGYGLGNVEIEDERAALRSSGTSLLTGAAGGSRTLLTGAAGGLRVRGEGWLTRASVSEGEELDSLTLDMQRIRLLLEWSHRYRTEGGDEIAFLLEGGMRYDGGSGAQGTGVEVASGMRLVNAALGVRLEGRGRTLLTGQEGYQEWGIGGLVQIDPEMRGEGLSLRVAPTWGDATGGARELWERGVSELQRDDHDRPGGRLDAEIAYGLRGFGGTPYGGLLLGDRGSRAYSSGLRYDLGRGMGLRVEATRREGFFGPPQHTIGLRGRLRFG